MTSLVNSSQFAIHRLPSSFSTAIATHFNSPRFSRHIFNVSVSSQPQQQGTLPLYFFPFKFNSTIHLHIFVFRDWNPSPRWLFGPRNHGLSNGSKSHQSWVLIFHPNQFNFKCIQINTIVLRFSVDLTVWNRTKSKCDALITLGAK